MSRDPEVMKYFPSTLSRLASDAMAEQCEALIPREGGVWAVERRDTGALIGIVGLHEPRADLPPSPCVEVLWRLARPYWGYGYATEAAAAVLEAGFEPLDLTEIVAFAVVDNRLSRAVMERLGMVDTGDTFDHPDVAKTSPLREHCWYALSRSRWRSLAADDI